MNREDGIIEWEDDRICYCFAWTKTAITDEIVQAGTTKALHDIRFKMKTKGCSCATLNPSGKCCLSDVKRFVETLKGKRET